MKRFSILAILGVCGLLALSAACQRTDMDITSPTGPSTLSITFELEASPNVILSTDVRPLSTITGIVRKNGQPMANHLVYFTILSGPGEFADYTQRTSAWTDSTGVATVIYLGPTKFEISGDTNAAIKAQLETTTPTYIHKTIDIRILKGD
jgi:hypothetical protein